MSAGSPIVPVRFPPKLLAAIDFEIARLNLRRFEAPHTRSSFIVSAVLEAIVHRGRSRAKRRRSSANPYVGEDGDDE